MYLDSGIADDDFVSTTGPFAIFVTMLCLGNCIKNIRLNRFFISEKDASPVMLKL